MRWKLYVRIQNRKQTMGLKNVLDFLLLLPIKATSRRKLSLRVNRGHSWDQRGNTTQREVSSLMTG